MTNIVFGTPEARYRLASALASGFHIPRDLLYENIEGDALCYFPLLHEKFDVNYQFLCATANSLNLNTLFYYNKFIKSEIMNIFAQGQSAANSNYAMALSLKGVLWIIEQTDKGYDGYGGILIQDNDKKEGFIIEPVKNWIKKWIL